MAFCPAAGRELGGRQGCTPGAADLRAVFAAAVSGQCAGCLLHLPGTDPGADFCGISGAGMLHGRHGFFPGPGVGDGQRPDLFRCGPGKRRSLCGGLRCRASEGPRSWLPCCPMSSPNRGADAGRYAEKTRQIHTSPVPRMRPLAPEAKKDPAGTACGVSFCCDFTHLRGAEPDRRRRQRMR